METRPRTIEGKAMSDRVPKIGIEEIFEAAAAGVLRGMKAREIAVERLVASGFTVRIDLTAGGPWLQQLSRVALNPQPLPPEPPPREIGGSAGE
jgi:hypothetical protein